VTALPPSALPPHQQANTKTNVHYMYVPVKGTVPTWDLSLIPTGACVQHQSMYDALFFQR
jgi:hypothetical protein